MGLLYYKQLKDLEKAVHYLKLAITEEKNVTAMFDLAVIYEEKGDKHKAKELYQEVLKLDPNNFKSKVNYAILLDKEGKGGEAHDYYQDALALNP